MARETTTSASKQGQNCGEMGSFDQAGKPRPRRQAVPLPYLRTCIGAPEKAGWRGSSRTACLETGGVSQAAGPGCVRPGCGTRLRPCMISRKTPTRRAGAWEDWAREGRGRAGVCPHPGGHSDVLSSRGVNTRYDPQHGGSNARSPSNPRRKDESMYHLTILLVLRGCVRVWQGRFRRSWPITLRAGTWSHSE